MEHGIRRSRSRSSPNGAVLIGAPPIRLADDGKVLTIFQRIDPAEVDGPALFSEHRSVRFPDGSVLFPIERDRTAPSEFIRWRPDGQRDFSFRFVPPRYGPGDRYGPQVRAAALLADGSVLFATGKPATVPASSWPDLPRLRRLLPDPDLRLTDVRVTAGELRATLATQPDIDYEVRSRASLQGPPSASIYQSTGDGYLDEVATPAAGTEAFLELHRDDTLGDQ